jgi:erythronate-4-phosphate dehydrogenase
MKIVADENIPLLKEFFSKVGDISVYPGRSLNAELVADADILLVRSVTPVDESLLSGSRVKFVGTTTIGLDHIDTAYLQRQGIGFCSAPGCNASAVMEYIVSVLSVLSEQQGFRLHNKSVGIIGRGQIGSRLAAALAKMGVRFKANDPPREAAGETELYSLEDVLACDIISVHVPLIEDGPWPTRNLIHDKHLKCLTANQILINTSRGHVIDEAALKRRLVEQKPPTIVLDVFRGEPVIDRELANLCQLATPHIAGYSLEGKTNGTEMVYQSLCRYSGLPVRYSAAQFVPEPSLKKLVFSADADVEYALHTAVRACYDVRFDNSQLRHTLELEPAARASAFDLLRKCYRQRRSFGNTEVCVPMGRTDVNTTLAAVGFKVTSE